MGNRNSYPAEHNREARRSNSERSFNAGVSSLFGSSTFQSQQGRPGEQTVCPQCQRVLLVPPAPIFRCPCGVLFRTENSSRDQRHQHLHHHLLSGRTRGRTVLCRQCRQLSILPPSTDNSDIVMCRCGAPALPLNDMVLSLLAEGDLGFIMRGRGEPEGASHDLINMLPTCQFSKVNISGGGSGKDNNNNSCKDKGEGITQENLSGAKTLISAEDSAGPSMATTTSLHTKALDDDGETERTTKQEEEVAAVAEEVEVQEAQVLLHEGKEAEDEGAEKVSLKKEQKPPHSPASSAVVVAAPHGDDISCRVCFDEYEEGDEQRVLPCFHKFHKICIDEWLLRKKLCPLCNTSIDIILRSTADLA